MQKKDTEVTLGGQISATSTVSVEIWTPLHPILYRVAGERLDESKEARKQGTEGNQKELESSMVAIVLAVTCLESFINAEGRNRLGDSWEAYTQGEGRKNDKRPRIRDKWFELPAKLNEGRTFDKGAEPFQDFHELVSLRNYIIHHDTIPMTPQSSPIGNVSEARARINYDSALKGISAMKGMLTQFHVLSGEDVPDWIN